MPLIILLALCSCESSNREKEDETSTSESPQFVLLSPDSTNIQFTNTLSEGLNTNVLMYEYFYNGGGVAVGDVNDDGLEDIYFSGNMTENKLYLNRGNLKFTDITSQAGVGGRPGPWKTGVTMADVNGDGRTDIYACYSGKLPGSKRTNQLFINQGNNSSGIPVFGEEAQQYGLADSAFSTSATFFDYDRDADLDMFLLNHSPVSLPVLDEVNTAAMLKATSTENGVKLFRNEHGHFKDVTASAQISSSALTYGLGCGISDLNNDGWPDIYVSNDYTIPDYLYINNKDGTFSNQLQQSLGHTAQFSMGNDIADVNNDGLPDILTLDMLPEDNRRQKLLVTPDNYEKFELSLRSGFYYQYMRNMLQISNGNGTFSETGQLSGVSNTDWSWAPLFADLDNDGWKDLFVTNGVLRDFTNMDFVKYSGDFLQSNAGNIRRQNLLDLVHKMPSSLVNNYVFKNNGDLTFKDVGKQWGILKASNSNGAAYADLDNDGDLDLVTNNINDPSFIFENKSNENPDRHYLQLILEGEGLNTDGLGARVVIFHKGKKQLLEQMPARGFQSSVSAVLHFGLGTEKLVDSLQVVWLSGKQQTLINIKADQKLSLLEKDAVKVYRPTQSPSSFYQETPSPVDYKHPKNAINDFKRQPLLVNPQSFIGPCIAKGDFNRDGLEDLFTGGSDGNVAAMYLQNKNGQFKKMPQPALEQDKGYEDADALIFDANNDGWPDLYVCSGGYHNYEPGDALLQDRLYINNGKSELKRDADALPTMRVSKSCVRKADINGDGYPDLFVGGRVIPGRYPETPSSFFLVNDGKGKFTNKIESISRELQTIGMVTDAVWVDLNNDRQNDLVVIGEWMPVSIFIQHNGKLENKTSHYFNTSYTGWWNTLCAGDYNGDGKTDLVIGNFGLNTQCMASQDKPAELFFKDFDENGSVDPIFCFYIKDTSYPYITRDELLDQMSIMRTRFTDYGSYAGAGLNDIFTPSELQNANHLRVNYLKTALFLSRPDGKFQEQVLPVEAQLSPVFSITPLDYNTDGNADLLLCGNINKARLRFGKYDANYGVLMKGDGKGNFSYVPQAHSGFKLTGDVRSVVSINDMLLFGINQGALKAYSLNGRKQMVKNETKAGSSLR